LKPSFVGIQFATEIGQAFYEKTRFALENVKDLSYILRYGPLKKCPVRPPSDFIRRLDINLSFGDLVSIGSYAKRRIREEGLHRDTYEYQMWGISDCRMIEYAKSLELRIFIDSLSPRTTDKWEEALVPIVYDLKSKGVQVYVGCVDGCSIWREPIVDYDKPLSEWEEKIRTNSVFVSNLQIYTI
jgi:hypothetical protein